MIHFICPAAEDLFREYLDHWGRDIAGAFRLLHYEDWFQQDRLEPGTYVFAALDRLIPEAARLVDERCQALDALSGVTILNHPRRVLRRFDLLAELSRLGRNDFQAIRATEDPSALRYPVFLREAGSHQGALSPLLSSPREVEAWIGRAVLRGFAVRDLMIVEFCETRDDHGLYRKYAAFVVGTRIVARGLECGRAWMLKRRGTEFSRDMVLEERDYVAANPHARDLADVAALAKIQYGRIDYALKDGRLQVWEINVNPTIGRGTRPRPAFMTVSSEIEAIRSETKACFYAGFRAAWQAVAVASAAPSAAPVVISTSRSRPVTRLGGERWRDRWRRVLDLASPPLRPLVAPLLPGLGRLARHAGRRASA